MNNDFGKVSVIVPVYNVEKYFDECINSILHQTYENLEIVIIDDGSEDSCGEKADDYARMDGRIKVFHTENGGISMARNLGLKYSTGDYCCFIDSDDFYELNFIERMLEALVKYNADMVFCNMYSCYIDNDVPNSKLQTIESGKIFSSDEYLYMFYAVSGVFSFVWNKLYKKEIFDDLKFKQMICEDAQIMLYIVDRCDKITFLSDVLYHYRRRKSSLYNKDKEAILLAEMMWIKDHMSRLKDTKRQSLFNLAQKLYIRKIFEEYHFCSKGTRKKTIRPNLKREMKSFMRNSEIDAKLRLKYLAVSLIPYIFGIIAFREKEKTLFWD
jgi:glycosyltransferase involved in cell wall biosynthesis